jgi:hypothetical protein
MGRRFQKKTNDRNEKNEAKARTQISSQIQTRHEKIENQEEGGTAGVRHRFASFHSISFHFISFHFISFHFISIQRSELV